MKTPRQQRGARARDQGRRAEWIAALWLMWRGWRIVAFRHRTRYGEMDLLAQKKDVLAVIEVKRRATLDEALAAVKPIQRRRLLRAATALAAARADGRALSVRLDLIAMAPGRLPVHIENAWGEAL
jgi:putative endonuclease